LIMKSLLRKYKIVPKKRWSQNFLISKPVILFMASYARGVVLEIGPGLGFITAELAKRADKVIAIEKDRKFVEILQNEYSFDNVEIINEDVMTLDLPDFDRAISNIPYHISSHITFKLLDHRFELAVLSYQKEFAQRLVEVPPSPRVSRLSVMVQAKADCCILKTVSRRNFYPVPETDCALVKITPHEKIATDAFFENVVRGLFSHKRKTVKNALVASTDLIGSRKDEIQTLSIPYGERRVWSLTLEEIRDISDALKAEEFLCSGVNSSR
jgi:16S rRNA (adenine1518-N6/adenine1519-N6)-dimethyltransferase